MCFINTRGCSLSKYKVISSHIVVISYLEAECKYIKLNLKAKITIQTHNKILYLV